ncbi:MAG: phosphoglucosamine mutase [Candidatus Margulisiibacteriota bacterium]|nr:MAG: phosphoglucosamine mutase [Candidatus Margulisbacteria bacterium GWD2_39_127]OGI03771.1 MAG: phosphoglucosamine mutase [Candidatus Margulisbacteria bacterium GWF2_38_17]OGI05827.1 MAG: phosphoglucosamine mutase [Candidatus Margulisbacteria bacterium GWE2_39_32]PZM77422.1 MAG: phosphoglucosamine mutase [Candidatus Margulisiibacteriota bacterium]HAR64103.1 phosphoglucosamine mutase [Candidatus Margulisiibacteriota bacterium]
MSLKISISGVRGIANESLTPDIALDFALAFGTYCKGGKVILGYDTRLSGPFFKHAVISGLMATGCDIVDIGVVPTPTVQIMVREMNAAGGLIITASHNPVMWNGLKFVRNDGIFLNESQAQEVIDIYNSMRDTLGKSSQRVSYRDFNNLGSLSEFKDGLSIHKDKVLKVVNTDLIKSKKFKVAIDVCNGAGAVVLPALLEELGCEVTVLNHEPSGRFAHNPEPVPQNLTELSTMMNSGTFDIGFAVDADADRLAILNEQGEPIGEDYTLTLVTDYMLSQTTGGGLVVTNLSTSQCIDEIAARYGATVIRTRIGEVNVSEVLKDKKATVGGEGNGGVMVPAIGFGRDTLVGISFVLELLATRNKTLSGIVMDMPQYIMVKDKIEFSADIELELIMKRIREKYSHYPIDDKDGIKILFDRNWVHIRPSNTEPIIRIIAEDVSREGAQALIAAIKGFF